MPLWTLIDVAALARDSAHAMRAPKSCSDRLAERFERGPELGGEELGLLPRREVAALVELVVMDELGIGALRPAPRGRIDLVWKDAHGNRDGDVFRGEKIELAFPIETSRRDRRV